MEKKKHHKPSTSPLFRVIKAGVRAVYPKYQIEGLDRLPDEPCVIVGNHSQMHGPIACELYFPDDTYTWCAGQMMHLKDVPSYAFQDFWSQKPKRSHWYYKAASYAIAPLSVLIFNNARTIGVYRDSRILSTFKETVSQLIKGNRVIIFPEHDQTYNHIIYDFQDRFIDIAKLYHKRTGKELLFVPLYIAPKRKCMYLGEPTRFSSQCPIQEERERIRDHLMNEITSIACALPKHTVVPYRNIPKSQYPCNKDGEGRI